MQKPVSDSFALFRLPNQPAKLILGNCTSKMQPVMTLTGTTAFTISPFNKRDLAYAITANSIQNFDANQTVNLPYSFSNNQYPVNANEHFMAMVAKAVDTMKNDHSLRKVVLSRNKTIALNSFDPLTMFAQLTEAFPHAFVYLVSSPHTGTWMGASPELLLSSEKQTLKTVALAGTLPTHANLVWEQKEIEEQKLVEVYIEAALNLQGLTYIKNGPEDLVTGNIKHLHTRYNIEEPKQNYAAVVSKLICDLNPTSAVCGLPKEHALTFISEHENYLRNFYTGFAGVIEGGELQLFVNLRCMEWQQNHATLFAGAGITASSDPSKELNETEIKMQALQQFLKP